MKTVFIQRVSEDVEFKLKIVAECGNNQLSTTSAAEGPVNKGGFHIGYHSTDVPNNTNWDFHNGVAYKQRQVYTGRKFISAQMTSVYTSVGKMKVALL